MIRVGSKRALLGAGGDPDVLLWRDAVVANGGTVSAERLAVVNALASALKSGGIWPDLDRLWLHAAEDSVQGLVDLKAGALATAVNSPTFTTDRGFAGDGTTSYINSGFNASTAGGKFTRNNAGMGGWCETVGSGNLRVLIGHNDSAYSRISQNFTNLTVGYGINSATSPSNIATPVLTGFFHAARTGASVTASYRNGVQVTTDVTASTALTNQTHRILANISSGGALSSYSNARTAVSFIGASLDGKEAAFYNALRAWATAVGIA